jgi:hypothetical protein
MFYVCVTALALLGNLEGELAKVLLVPHVLVGLLEAGEVKDLVIDDGVDVVGLNGSAHVLHLQARADEDTADGADVHEGVEVGRLVLAHAADEADDGDDAVNGDGLERLRHSRGPADLDDVLDADAAGRQLLGLLTPVGRLLVVDDVVGAVLLQQLGLLGGAGGRDDAGAGSLCELQREDADAAGTLRQDRLAGLERAALEAVQRVPGRQTGAAEGAGLEEVEVRGGGYETLLAEDAVVAEGAVDGTTETGGKGGTVKRAAEVALVEEGNDLV